MRFKIEEACRALLLEDGDPEQGQTDHSEDERIATPDCLLAELVFLCSPDMTHFEKGELRLVVGSTDYNIFRLELHLPMSDTLVMRITPKLHFRIHPGMFTCTCEDTNQSHILQFYSDVTRSAFAKMVALCRYVSFCSAYDDDEIMVCQELHIGEGNAVQVGDTVNVKYTGWKLTDGFVFAKNQQLTLHIATPKELQTLEDGILGMMKFGIRAVICAPSFVAGLNVCHFPFDDPLLLEIEVLCIEYPRVRSSMSDSTSPTITPKSGVTKISEDKKRGRAVDQEETAPQRGKKVHSDLPVHLQDQISSQNGITESGYSVAKRKLVIFSHDFTVAFDLLQGLSLIPEADQQKTGRTFQFTAELCDDEFAAANLEVEMCDLVQRAEHFIQGQTQLCETGSHDHKILTEWPKIVRRVRLVKEQYTAVPHNPTLNILYEKLVLLERHPLVELWHFAATDHNTTSVVEQLGEQLEKVLDVGLNLTKLITCNEVVQAALTENESRIKAEILSLTEEILCASKEQLAENVKYTTKRSDLVQLASQKPLCYSLLRSIRKFETGAENCSRFVSRNIVIRGQTLVSAIHQYMSILDLQNCSA